MGLVRVEVTVEATVEATVKEEVEEANKAEAMEDTRPPTMACHRAVPMIHTLLLQLVLVMVYLRRKESRLA